MCQTWPVEPPYPAARLLEVGGPFCAAGHGCQCCPIDLLPLEPSCCHWISAPKSFATFCPHHHDAWLGTYQNQGGRQPISWTDYGAGYHFHELITAGLLPQASGWGILMVLPLTMDWPRGCLSCGPAPHFWLVEIGRAVAGIPLSQSAGQRQRQPFSWLLPLLLPVGIQCFILVHFFLYFISWVLQTAFALSVKSAKLQIE